MKHVTGNCVSCQSVPLNVAYCKLLFIILVKLGTNLEYGSR